MYVHVSINQCISKIIINFKKLIIFITGPQKKVLTTCKFSPLFFHFSIVIIVLFFSFLLVYSFQLLAPLAFVNILCWFFLLCSVLVVVVLVLVVVVVVLRFVIAVVISYQIRRQCQNNEPIAVVVIDADNIHMYICIVYNIYMYVH